MNHAAECFSGTCGLCNKCNINTGFSFRGIKQKEMKREEDLSKLIGKNNMEEMKDRYNKNLKKWCKKYGYKDPSCYGYAPEKINETFTGRNEKYEIIDKNHNHVCNNTYCRMMYISSTSWEQQKKYSLLPIYKNIKGDKYLCGLCLTNDSFKI